MFKLMSTLLLTTLLHATTLMAATDAKTNVTTTNSSPLTVNKVPISQETFADSMRDKLSKGAQDSPQLRKAVLDELVIAEALAQQAIATKLNSNPDIKRAFANAQREILAQAYLIQQYNQHPITDTDVKQEYDRQVALTKEGRNATEYKASQIVVSDEQTALTIINRLNAGEDFASLAKTVSIDPSAQKNGGDLPWSLPDQLIAPLGDTLMGLTKDTFTTTPVKTDLGWHILKLTDSRPFKAPSFEETQPHLKQSLIERRKQEIIQQVMQKTSINTK